MNHEFKFCEPLKFVSMWPVTHARKSLLLVGVIKPIVEEKN